eukprot:TRINITY_DN46506_c0_g1_i1.p1 TRINITY_DN46506_c0_g1~~TRINITY_DN46506_c0_g1_i1.p1  ORF type:complete len:679 (-),score=53.04 TRINITY_DN46506_c0_g1_i1:145-2181(-)
MSDFVQRGLSKIFRGKQRKKPGAVIDTNWSPQTSHEKNGSTNRPRTPVVPTTHHNVGTRSESPSPLGPSKPHKPKRRTKAGKTADMYPHCSSEEERRRAGTPFPEGPELPIYPPRSSPRPKEYNTEPNTTTLSTWMTEVLIAPSSPSTGGSQGTLSSPLTPTTPHSASRLWKETRHNGNPNNNAPQPTQRPEIIDPRCQTEEAKRALQGHLDFIDRHLKKMKTALPYDIRVEVGVSEGSNTARRIGPDVERMIKSKTVVEAISRYEECLHRYGDLYTLNQFYNLFHCFLAVGGDWFRHKLTNSVDVNNFLKCMQYNPKFNSRIPLSHQHQLPQRIHVVPLPPHISDLITAIASLQYIRDCIIAWVCDDVKYASFSAHLKSLQLRLVERIREKRSILNDVFAVIRQDVYQYQTASWQDTVNCLQFLNEYCKTMTAAGSSVDTPDWWRELFIDHNLLHTIMMLLDKGPIEVQQACLDLLPTLTEAPCPGAWQVQMPVDGKKHLFGCILEPFQNPNCTMELAAQVKDVVPRLWGIEDLKKQSVEFYNSCRLIMEYWAKIIEQDAAKLSAQRHEVLAFFLESMALWLGTDLTSSNSVRWMVAELLSVLWKNATHIPTPTLIASNKAVQAMTIYTNQPPHVATKLTEVLQMIELVKVNPHSTFGCSINSTLLFGKMYNFLPDE